MADKSTPEEIGARLRRLRGDRSLAEFSAELGCSKAEYIGYETGRSEIPVSLLIALFEYGKIDPAWVLTGQSVGSPAEAASIAGTIYSAVLKAAERAGVTLSPAALIYAIQSGWTDVSRGRGIDDVKADILVKLATMGGKGLQ